MKHIMNKTLIMVVLVGMIFGLAGCGDNKLGKIKIETGIATWTDVEVKYYIEDERIVKFDHIEDKIRKKEGELGGKKIQNYWFKGLQEGKTKIRFEILDGNGEVSSEQIYEIKVDKRLNVTIVDK